MPTYIPKALKRFLQTDPQDPFYSPHKWTVPEYSQGNQYAKGLDSTPPLD